MQSRLLRPSCAAFAAALLIVSIGCESMHSTVLIGENATLDPDSWNGPWQIYDTVVHMRIGEGGVVHTATADWSDSVGAFELTKMDFIVTSLGSSHYIHVEIDEEETQEAEETAHLGSANAKAGDDLQPTRYHLARLEQPEADTIVLYWADSDAFRIAIEEGRLKGTIETKGAGIGKSQTVILNDKDSLDTVIAAGAGDRLFSHDKKFVFRRVKPIPLGGE